MEEKRQKEYHKTKAPWLDFWPFPLVKSIKLSIPSGVTTVDAMVGEYALAEQTGVEKITELPSRLGLGTMYIARPYVDGLILLPEYGLVVYGDVKVLGTQPHLTCGLAYTYCV